jgi:hypothetical protein
MNVDFNNMRRQTARCLDRLIQTLNENTEKDDFHGDFIRVNVTDIEKDIDDLSMLVGCINCVYNEDDENFKDLSEETHIRPFHPIDPE